MPWSQLPSEIKKHTDHGTVLQRWFCVLFGKLVQSGFIPFCFAIPPMNAPKSLLDFAHQQRLAIFGAKTQWTLSEENVSAMGQA
jgi:hypothetical protein